MVLGWGGTIVLGPYAPCPLRFAHPSGVEPIPLGRLVIPVGERLYYLGAIGFSLIAVAPSLKRSADISDFSCYAAQSQRALNVEMAPYFYKKSRRAVGRLLGQESRADLTRFYHNILNRIGEE